MFDESVEGWIKALHPDRAQSLAGRLGVSADSLARLTVGWSTSHQAFTFPMRSVEGSITGIRLRLLDDSKLSIKGSREGLFIPTGLSSEPRPGATAAPEPLLICEGPTDTAAMLDLGFNAIGRPSCTGGIAAIVEFVRRNGSAATVVIADADQTGIRGARNLGSTLRAYARDVRIVSPPAGIDDARTWKQRGATRADVQSAIAKTDGLQFTITSKVRN